MTRHGYALLEVLVAFNLLALGGTGYCALMLQARDALDRAERQEREMRAATSLMTGLALLSGSALNQRLGVQLQEGMLVEIQRPRPTLFRVGIAPQDAPGRELLVSVFYRP